MLLFSDVNVKTVPTVHLNVLLRLICADAALVVVTHDDLVDVESVKIIVSEDDV